MAITNRDLDVSQQKDVYQWFSGGAIATSTTRMCAVIPYPCMLQSVASSATGVSNAMQVAIQIKRFIVGSGETAILAGISNIVLQNSSLSGPVGFSGLAAQSSTLLQLAAGDVLQVVTSVTNGNATDLAINFVVKKLQDIVSHNGVAT